MARGSQQTTDHTPYHKHVHTNGTPLPPAPWPWGSQRSTVSINSCFCILYFFVVMSLSRNGGHPFKVPAAKRQSVLASRYRLSVVVPQPNIGPHSIKERPHIHHELASMLHPGRSTIATWR